MSAPGRLTPNERRVVERHRTPRSVQQWLRSLAYNWEPNGATMRSFRGVVRHRAAHCLEGALAAATILERHGYPPLLLDLESQDRLDHVVFAFRDRGRWGAVGMSRDVGLWGRKPVFRSARALVFSYYEPFVDLEARITGYALVDLRELGGYDWRLSRRNVWKVERLLIGYPHTSLRTSHTRYIRLRRAYERFTRDHDPRDTPFKRGAHTWT